MARLLVVESDADIARAFSEILGMYDEFDVDIVDTYKNAQSLLRLYRYEFGVADLSLQDAPNGEVIALFNKHNVSPIIFTDKVDDDFLDTYESASISSYALKNQADSVYIILDKLRQLFKNKTTTILIVSNSHTYTNYLKQNLSMHNFKLILATNSAETLKKISIHQDIDLIITEYDLPYVNGLELVKKIRQTKSKKELSILTLTDDPESEITLSFLNEGVNDYLIKPFTRDEFYTSIYKNVETI